MRQHKTERANGKERPTRLFVHCTASDDENAAGRYLPIRTVLASADLRTHMVHAALRDLQSYTEKYRHFEELSAIFSALDALLPA